MPSDKGSEGSQFPVLAPENGGGVKGWWMRVCQQKMHGWAPRPSIASVLCYYIAASSLLLALGAAHSATPMHSLL